MLNDQDKRCLLLSPDHLDLPSNLHLIAVHSFCVIQSRESDSFCLSHGSRQKFFYLNLSPFILQVLEKKFKDFVNETKPLGHSKVASLNELASKLDKEGHSKMDVIQKRTKQINEMWETLCNAIQMRTEVGNTWKTGASISLQSPTSFFPKPLHCSSGNTRFTGAMSTFCSIFSRCISLYSHCLPYCSWQGSYLKDVYQLRVIVFLNSLLTLVPWKTKPIQQFTTTSRSRSLPLISLFMELLFNNSLNNQNSPGFFLS